MSSPKIYNTQFWLLCLASLLFFASFNMVIPELPDYLTNLGGADYKGLIIALFTVTAMISRPFSGKLTDTIGRMPVILFGVGICVVCSLCYPFVTTLFAFFALRLVHGFSTGFSPTGMTAYLADVIPAHKRGEAVGILGTAGTVGMALGPAIGGAIANQVSLNTMFYCSSFFAILSMLLVLRSRETLKEKQAFTFSLLRVGKSDFFEPRVLLPSMIMLLTAFAYGAVYTLLPDFGKHLGIKNKGLLFTYFTIASLTVRLIAGKASDRYGREPVLRISTFIMLAAMLVLGFATSQQALIVGVVLYGLAQGATSPTLLAWATDLSDPAFKGRGISSLYIFMEFGIGAGAFLSGWVYGNDAKQFFPAFLICALLCGSAFLYLASRWRTQISEAK